MNNKGNKIEKDMQDMQDEEKEFLPQLFNSGTVAGGVTGEFSL